MKRSKIEMQGLLERIVSMYANEKKTIMQITKILSNENYTVSKSGIHRALKSNQEIIKKHNEIQEQAKAILSEVKNDPNLNISELIMTLSQEKLFECLKNSEFSAADFKNPDKLLDSIARMGNAQVNLSRLKKEYIDGFKYAIKEVEINLLQILKKDNPKILQKIISSLKKIEPKKGN